METPGAVTITGIESEAKLSGAQPALRVQAVNHYFGAGETRKQVLTDNAVSLMAGEMVIMTGPSGSGKSTLLTLVGGLRKVQEGSVHVLGRELHGLDDRSLTLVRRSIGFIFQAHNLFDSLTALQNVRTSMELHDEAPAERDKKAIAALTRLGLGERIHYKPGQLSGGQRQRVAIARALVNRPKLVLADEPTAALDKASGREVVTILKELAREEGSTILLVTHDSRIIDVADRIVNMVDGRIVSEIFVEETVRMVEFLKRSKLFEASAPDTLTTITQKMVAERLPVGTVVVRQGDEGDKFYVIRRGGVEVRREEKGTATTVATLGSGEFFGEVALMSGERRNATVVVTEPDTVLYSLKKQDFLAALAAAPSLDQQLRSVFFRRQ
jgi:putative ABC transport system ATP-binding protein